MISDYEFHLIRGDIFERANEFDRALDEYQYASTFVSNEKDEINVLAQVARLRVLVLDFVDKG